MSLWDRLRDWRRPRRPVPARPTEAVVDDWARVRPLLLPVLRGATRASSSVAGSTDADPSAATSPGARPLSRSFLPYLAELVVIDEQTSTGYPTADRAANWGVSVAQVFAAARENLAALIGPLDGTPSPAPSSGPVAGPRPAASSGSPASSVPAASSGAPASSGPAGATGTPGASGTPSASGTPGSAAAALRLADDGRGYLASRLFADGWLAGCADRVGGRPVAFAPDRTGLLIFADKPDALAEVFPIVEATYREAPGAISPMAYVSDDNGRTVPYDAPPGHPLHHAVRRAERILAVTEYGQQSGALGSQWGGTDLIEPALFVRADGSCFTLADWPASGYGLLPAVDIVRFGSSASQLTVAWAVVIELGLLDRVTGMAPGRYRAAGHPVGEVLAALHAEAVEV